MRITPIREAYTASQLRNVRSFRPTPAQLWDGRRQLDGIGVDVPDGLMDQARRAYGTMDSMPQGVSTASIGTLAQFAQAFLPGVVRNAVAPMVADDLMGSVVAGTWADEEIVQPAVESLGSVNIYTDRGAPRTSNFNPGYNVSTIIRFEGGFEVGDLEAERAGLARFDAGFEKRRSQQLAHAINLNAVSFYGFNGGAQRTYGMLNAPGLPSYGSASKTFVASSFDEMVTFFITAASQIHTATKGLVDFRRMKSVLAVATDAYTSLSRVNSLGTRSVRDWLASEFPGIRIESVPQFTGAVVGQNALYWYLETTDGLDESTDDNRVWANFVPVRYRLLGTQRLLKSVLEAGGSAHGGVMCKRPWAVARWAGV